LQGVGPKQDWGHLEWKDSSLHGGSIVRDLHFSNAAVAMQSSPGEPPLARDAGLGGQQALDCDPVAGLSTDAIGFSSKFSRYDSRRRGRRPGSPADSLRGGVHCDRNGSISPSRLGRYAGERTPQEQLFGAAFCENCVRPDPLAPQPPEIGVRRPRSPGRSRQSNSYKSSIVLA
jgi:hypothetical protein